MNFQEAILYIKAVRKVMFSKGAPSSRGTVVNPAAERKILLHQVQNPSPSQGAVPPSSRTSQPVSRPAATAKPPQMNFGDGDQVRDEEGDVDDGDHKAKRNATPEIHDEDTKAMPPGYHNLFMEAPLDEAHGPDTVLPETIAEPATIRKERATK